MHAPEQRFWLVASLATILLTAGCRTPLGDRTVEIRQQPRSSDRPLDQPRTRLATAQPNAAAATAPESTPSQSPAATASISDQAASPQTGLAENRAQRPPVTKASDPLMSEAEFMEAFADASPEVREAARRRLLASRQAKVPSGPLPDLPTREEIEADPFSETRKSAAPAPTDQVTQASPIENTAQGPAPAAEESPQADPAADIPYEIVAGDYANPDAETNAEATDSGVAAAAHRREPAAPADEVKTAGTPLAAAKRNSGGDVAQASAVADTGNTAVKPASATMASNAAEPETELSEQQLWERLLARHNANQAETPADDASAIAAEVRRRYLLLMAGRIDDAVEPIDGLALSEQEALRHQLLAIWMTMDPKGHPVPARRWSAALPHLREATSYMAASTGTLEVRALSFCTEVQSFGNIKPFENHRFKAGQQVILYSEIDNFTAERLSNGYETQFLGSYEVTDSSGTIVAQKTLPTDKQTCNNYRRDYFIAYRLHLPSQLTPGQYQLQLTIEDLKGKKYGQSSLEFDIVD